MPRVSMPVALAELWLAGLARSNIGGGGLFVLFFHNYLLYLYSIDFTVNGLGLVYR